MTDQVHEAARRVAFVTGHSLAAVETALRAKPDFADEILTAKDSWDVRRVLDNLFAAIEADKAAVDVVDAWHAPIVVEQLDNQEQ